MLCLAYLSSEPLEVLLKTLYFKLVFLSKVAVMNLDKIRIVLVETSHPGNIGSAARAMKIMGLSRLILVNPNQFPDPKANELASHADDILAKAQVVKTLDEALESCSLVVGMSARDRVMSQTIMNPREIASKVIKEYASHSSVAFVFGRENS